MAITAKALDVSQLREPLPFSQNTSLSSGETGVLAYVPFPCALIAAQIGSFSVESAPNMLLTVSRFIVGQGMTTINLGSTFALVSYGTSGVLGSGVSLPAAGSTLNMLMANDVLGYQIGGGATSAVFGIAGCFIIQPNQGILTYLGGLA